jgi:GNAT superfamily N-acetyltransferase
VRDAARRLRGAHPPHHAGGQAALRRGLGALRRDLAAAALHGHQQQLTLEDLAFFTELDHADHEALGAFDPDTGDGLGVARYVRDPARPDTAEAAVSVIDSWQGRGLGGALLERLTERACEHGIRRFSAELRADNRRMLRLFEHLGRTDVRRDAGDLELDVDLRTTRRRSSRPCCGRRRGDVAPR